MYPKLSFGFVFIFFGIARCSYPTFDEYIQYIVNYINFTSYYQLPTNNYELYQTCDCMVHDFGSYDFIIVGGGTAGSVLANRLSEIPTWNVLLLEAGGAEDDFSDIPAMNYYLRNSPMNWGYYTKPQKNSCLGMIERRCVYPTGKVLGGSGVLGDMVYARGSRVEYDNWAKKGNLGWSYDEILPYFKKSEQIQIEKYDPGFHGHNGPVFINYTYPPPVNFDRIIEANKACGLDEVDYNGENQIGISRFQWTIDFNKRQTGGSAFVTPVMYKRSNLNVSLKSFVTKVVLEGNRAVGVEFVKDGKKFKALAEKEVLLAGGAINSPQILMLSGIGPRDHLRQLDIEVKNDLPVGKYLTDHPAFVALYMRTDNPAVGESLPDMMEKYMNGISPLTSVFTAEPVIFMNTKDKNLKQPNLEIIFINPPLSVPPDPLMFYNMNPEYVELFADLNTMTDHLIYLVNIQPKSRGTVTLKSKSPVDFPIIDPQYYTDPNDEDIEVIYEGIKFVLNMTQAAPLQSINAKVIVKAPGCEHLRDAPEDREYWYCAIKHLTSTLYHPTGTTKMGISTKNSVVDAKLKVHNMEGLRVVDAGSIPEIVAGHPLAAVFMMAEKIADDIKSENNEL